jgi:hypothetical protein
VIETTWTITNGLPEPDTVRNYELHGWQAVTMFKANRYVPTAAPSDWMILFVRHTPSTETQAQAAVRAWYGNQVR